MIIRNLVTGFDPDRIAHHLLLGGLQAVGEYLMRFYVVILIAGIGNLWLRGCHAGVAPLPGHPSETGAKQHNAGNGGIDKTFFQIGIHARFSGGFKSRDFQNLVFSSILLLLGYPYHSSSKVQGVHSTADTGDVIKMTSRFILV